MSVAPALLLGCSPPPPTAPDKTLVYESPLSPSAEPVPIELASVEPRPTPTESSEAAAPNAPSPEQAAPDQGPGVKTSPAEKPAP